MKIKHRALEVPDTQRDDAVRRYATGESTAKIGRELGVKPDTIARWARNRGVKIRGRAEAQAAKWTPASAREIMSEFAAGASVLGLSKRYGVSRMIVLRVLRDAGIATRSRSDAEVLKWRALRKNPEAVRRQMSAAWAGRHGGRLKVVHPPGGKIGKYELELVAAVRHRGHVFTNQFEIITEARRARGMKRYYLDLALEEASVAVEVTNGWSQGPTGSLRRDRLEHLFDLGWAILILYVPQRRTPVSIELLADKIIAFTKIARAHKSARGQYGMIDRYGEPTSIFGLDVNHRARVPGF